MIGVVAGNRRRSGAGGGGFTTIAALFASGEKGAYYDFTDKSRLAVNADGSGGSPANGGTAKWAADQSPNANHLRNTVASVAVGATGVTTSGSNYGLFNMSGFGNWPLIPQPFEIVVALEQIAYAGDNARIIGDQDTSWSLLQGSSSGDARFLGINYGLQKSLGIGAEVTLDILTNGASSAIGLNGGAMAAETGSGSAGLNALCLGSTAGGNSAAQVRFKRLLVIGRALTPSERAGVLAWVSA